MNPVHHSGKQCFLVTVAAIRQLLVAVISAPDAARVVGCEADEPDILVVRGRSGLSGDGLAGCRNRLIGRTGRVGDDALHCRGQKKGGRVLQYAGVVSSGQGAGVKIIR